MDEIQLSVQLKELASLLRFKKVIVHVPQRADLALRHTCHTFFTAVADEVVMKRLVSSWRYQCFGRGNASSSQACI